MAAERVNFILYRDVPNREDTPSPTIADQKEVEVDEGNEVDDIDDDVEMEEASGEIRLRDDDEDVEMGEADEDVEMGEPDEDVVIGNGQREQLGF
ncbi:hypothetical protein JOM56_006964 [Amanita muscaria]